MINFEIFQFEIRLFSTESGDSFHLQWFHRFHFLWV